MQIEVQCIKNYFKIFSSQEAGASRNNIEKEPQKPCPNLKIHIYIYIYIYIYILYLNIYREYMLCRQANASITFLQSCINFVGSIIP